MTMKDVLIENNFSTVLAEYIPEPRTEQGFQSEAELEKDFIKRLEKLGYERILNPTFEVIKNNLRRQLEMLNKNALGNEGFSDKEWESFFVTVLANANDFTKEKTKKFQIENRYNVTKETGEQVNIMLVDKQNIFNNSIQVFNQFKEEGTKYIGVYDVTILVNGLPIVHVELKRRGAKLRDAFNQVARYARDNFYGSSGLFDWVQIFVISNGTETKYYSNTTRELSIRESESNNASLRKRKTSHNFKFTSHWADEKNRNILDIVDFANTFFEKETLLNILTRYCVFDVDEKLLVMRPYQIVATEKIIQKIKYAEVSKKKGSIDAGGYIWHTTGSGKTLTSFKTAQIATGLGFIDKVIFVVDRKDLDYQTIKEFEKFGGRDSVSGNVSAKLLKQQLEKEDSRIIVTTIQKLNRFVDTNKGHKVFCKNCVLIFDECHRSQFGKMHKRITKAFKNYFIFGFTGTPIFKENATSGIKPTKNKKGDIEIIKTTEQIFGACLHKYTIVDAIVDGNVLPFRIDLVDTIKYNNGKEDVKVWSIDGEGSLRASGRISVIVKYILDNFNIKTYRNDGAMYEHSVISNTIELAKSKINNVDEKKDRRKIRGYNSIFAVDSIKSAMSFYKEFQKQQKERASDLRVVTIFSYSPNEGQGDFLEEEFETEMLDQVSRDFLENAIADYNRLFQTNWDTSAEKFQSFYKDVSMRVKNKEIDILIVVNMFLTGFDATTLNTLWIDKNLKYHGLIQALSRTNRILNDQKAFGNIVTFRKLEKHLNDACKLFGDQESRNVVTAKTFEEYYEGYDDKPGYTQIVDSLKSDYSLPVQIIGEFKEKEFVRLFGAFLRVENILMSFDNFFGKEILTPRERQDYQGMYNTLFEKYRRTKSVESVNIEDDLIFEMELVKQLTINVDYILMMVEKYKMSKEQMQELELANITSVIDSRPELRSKKQLILGFISSVNSKTNVVDKWINYVKEEKEKAINNLIVSENLNEKEAKKFMEYCLEEGEIKETGTDLDNILPPMSMFFEGDKRIQKKKIVMQKLRAFLEGFLF